MLPMCSRRVLFASQRHAPVQKRKLKQHGISFYDLHNNDMINGTDLGQKILQLLNRSNHIYISQHSSVLDPQRYVEHRNVLSPSIFRFNRIVQSPVHSDYNWGRNTCKYNAKNMSTCRIPVQVKKSYWLHRCVQ